MDTASPCHPTIGDGGMTVMGSDLLIANALFYRGNCILKADATKMREI